MSVDCPKEVILDTKEGCLSAVQLAISWLKNFIQIVSLQMIHKLHTYNAFNEFW